MMYNFRFDDLAKGFVISYLQNDKDFVVPRLIPRKSVDEKSGTIFVVKNNMRVLPSWQKYKTATGATNVRRYNPDFDGVAFECVNVLEEIAITQEELEEWQGKNRDLVDMRLANLVMILQRRQLIQELRGIEILTTEANYVTAKKVAVPLTDDNTDVPGKIRELKFACRKANTMACNEYTMMQIANHPSVLGYYSGGRLKIDDSDDMNEIARILGVDKIVVSKAKPDMAKQGAATANFDYLWADGYIWVGNVDPNPSSAIQSEVGFAYTLGFDTPTHPAGLGVYRYKEEKLAPTGGEVIRPMDISDMLIVAHEYGALGTPS